MEEDQLKWNPTRSLARDTIRTFKLVCVYLHLRPLTLSKVATVQKSPCKLYDYLSKVVKWEGELVVLRQPIDSVAMTTINGLIADDGVWDYVKGACDFRMDEESRELNDGANCCSLTRLIKYHY